MITQISLISETIQIVISALLLALSVKLIGDSKKNIITVFLSFCYALWLFTDLYWLIYDLMRPATRMPFAANEIGEVAFFLMVAETINSSTRRHSRLPAGFFAGSLIFAMSNAVLWILWSGEIVQDIIVGAVFVWLFYSIVRALRSEQAFGKPEWIILSILCISLIVCQGLTFTVPAEVKGVPDMCAYILMIAGIAFFIYKLIRAFKGDLQYAQMFLSFALVVWVTTSKYMSGGNWYHLFMNLETVFMPLWYITVRKVVKAE